MKTSHRVVLVRCRMATRRSCCEQYEGTVDCAADPSDRDDVFRSAVRKLRATAFPDYSASMWRLVSYEVVP